LIVLVGATGVGKTALSLRLAEHYACPIISADSRQIYREIPIGTAAPTAEEQAQVRHYFVGTKSVREDYNAGQYERDCLQLLDALWQQHDILVLTGGSMLYIDAVCHGLDDIPTVPTAVREQVRTLYKENGLEWLQQEVQRLDPAYWQIVDQRNPQRLMHCVEISLATNQPYSSFRQAKQNKRNFRIVPIGLERPREELYERINERVEQMMAAGLEEEARQVYPLRACNSLQTVGYRELFDYFDGKITKDEAIRLIKQNSRHYAKRQLTWFKADNNIVWLNATHDYDKTLDDIDTWVHPDGVL